MNASISPFNQTLKPCLALRCRQRNGLLATSTFRVIWHVPAEMKQITRTDLLTHMGLDAYCCMMAHTLPTVMYNEIALRRVALQD